MISFLLSLSILFVPVAHAEISCGNYGETVLAQEDGTVKESVIKSTREGKKSLGSFVLIQKQDGNETMYPHLIPGSNKKFVKKGQQIKAGDILGLSLGKSPCQEQQSTSSKPLIEKITPLTLQKGSETMLRISGQHLRRFQNPQFPFCSRQEVGKKTDEAIEISCMPTSAIGSFEGRLGSLDYQITVSDTIQGSSQITDLTLQRAKPGEALGITILGQSLNPSQISIDAGDCSWTKAFSAVRNTKLVTSCLLPLHYGPVEKESEIPLEVRVSLQGTVQKSERITISYGITGADLQPRTAVYYTPTRFTISGTNVHRATIFFIEGCQKSDIKILERNFDNLDLECFIEPQPNTDLSTLEGKIIPHLFLFKTQSRFNELGRNVLTDAEDKKNIILSGFIDMSYDRRTIIEDISPKEAFVGEETLYTITGKNLPYSSAAAPKIQIQDCTNPKNPEQYTPYSFQFRCTATLDNKAARSGDFSEKKAIELCDSIAVQPWSETEKKRAFELCYEHSASPIAKRSLWKGITDFFQSLPLRSVTILSEKGKALASLSVRFVSRLSEEVRNAQILGDISTEEGAFTGTGTAVVARILPESVQRNNRQEKITVLGTSLPRNLILSSQECDQIKTTYASSERYQYLCLLKKVQRQEILIIDPSTKKELSRVVSPLIEVYDIKALEKGEGILEIQVQGVNLDTGITLKSNSCIILEPIREASNLELRYKCTFFYGPFSKPKSIALEMSTAQGVEIFQDAVELTPVRYVSTQPQTPKLSLDTTDLEPTTVETRKLSLKSNLLSLDCSEEIGTEFFLGTCTAISPFLRSAEMLASMENQKAILQGEFDAGIAAVDQFVSSIIKGLRINPASGSGLFAFDIPDQSLLLEGEIKAFGLDLSGVLPFPFTFDLYDMGGRFYFSWPYFNISKTRDQSKILLGMGNLQHKQITILQSHRDKMVRRIEDVIRAGNQKIQEKKIEIGAKLLARIDNPTLKKLTRNTYIKVLKGLEIVPETVAFYDNFDLIAVGKLKSDPFKPASWDEAPFSANLAQLNLDFSAKNGEMILRGDVINSISLFNNEILKTDRGLLNLGLRVNLKKNNGMVILAPVEMRLPQDIASLKAGISVEQLFNPSSITIRGNTIGGIKIKDFEIFSGEADIAFDPQGTYQVGDYTTKGFLHFKTSMKIGTKKTKLLGIEETGLEGTGRVVFTHPGNELAMDFGGELLLKIFGEGKKLGDIFGRTRLGADHLRLCFNSETGKFEFTVPWIIKRWNIIQGDTVLLHGAISMDTLLEFKGVPSLDTLLLSGKTGAGDRQGFFWDNREGTGFFGVLSSSKEICRDVPGQDFLKKIRQFKYEDGVPPIQTEKQVMGPIVLGTSFQGMKEVSSIAKISHDAQQGIKTLWNIEGWMAVTPLNDKLQLVLSKDNAEVASSEGSFTVPGLWKFENPNYYVIVDTNAFFNSGYQLALRGPMAQGYELGVSLYTNEQEYSGIFPIPALSDGLHKIDFAEFPKNKIKIDSHYVEIQEPKTIPITETDRKLEVEVSSDEQFNLPTVEIPEELKKAIDALKGLSATSFPDIKSPLLREAVEKLSGQGIIKGYPDGTFQPDKTINRAEALKMIMETLQISDTEGSPGFPDVPPDTWFHSYVRRGFAKKIIRGYPDGKFRPDSPVGRAEFVKMAMISLTNYSDKTSPRKTLQQFQDIKARQWYLSPLAFAFEKGYIEKTKKFRPAEGMTRGEAALLLSKMLQ